MSPFITSVALTNFRGIAECDVKLGSLCILVGQNGSGKSSFLPRGCVIPCIYRAGEARKDWAMANCRICGEKAGFFRSAHQECVDQKRAEQDAALRAEHEAREAEVRAKSERLMAVARDIVTAAKATKPTAIRLENDDHIEIEVSSLPFNMLKSESLIYLEDHVSYHKYIRQRSHRTTGASFRVARGVWIRQNAGRSRADDQLENVDTGIFGITTKHIYFAGETQRFRIRLDKLVSHEAWQDALCVTRDNVTAQPEFFGTANPMGAAATMTAAYEAM